MNEKLKTNIDEFVITLTLKNRSDKTIKNYKKILLAYYDYCQNNHIEQQDRITILEYKKYLESKPKKPSVSTLKIIFSCIRSFYAEMELQGRCADIARHVKVEGIRNNFVKTSLSVKQAQALISKAGMKAKGRFHTIVDIRNDAIIWLMLTAGLRCIEVERSDKSDIEILDSEAGIIRLWVQGKGHATKDQFVMLEPNTYKKIQLYLSSRNDENSALFLTHPNNSLKRVNRIKSPEVSMMVKEMLRSIGIDNPKITAHSLRHTCAMLAFDVLGMSTDQVQQTLRHSDPKVTNIYTEQGSRINHGVENKMGNLFSQKKEIASKERNIEHANFQRDGGRRNS